MRAAKEGVSLAEDLRRRVADRRHQRVRLGDASESRFDLNVRWHRPLTTSTVIALWPICLWMDTQIHGAAAGALVFAAHQPLRQARRYARFKGALTATLGTYAGAMPPYTTGLAMETGLTTATGLAITG